MKICMKEKETGYTQRNNGMTLRSSSNKGMLAICPRGSSTEKREASGPRANKQDSKLAQQCPAKGRPLGARKGKGNLTQFKPLQKKGMQNQVHDHAKGMNDSLELESESEMQRRIQARMQKHLAKRAKLLR